MQNKYCPVAEKFGGCKKVLRKTEKSDFKTIATSSKFMQFFLIFFFINACFLPRNDDFMAKSLILFL